MGVTSSPLLPTGHAWPLQCQQVFLNNERVCLILKNDLSPLTYVVIWVFIVFLRLTKVAAGFGSPSSNHTQERERDGCPLVLHLPHLPACGQSCNQPWALRHPHCCLQAMHGNCNVCRGAGGRNILGSVPGGGLRRTVSTLESGKAGACHTGR